MGATRAERRQHQRQHQQQRQPQRQQRVEDVAEDVGGRGGGVSGRGHKLPTNLSNKHVCTPVPNDEERPFQCCVLLGNKSSAEVIDKFGDAWLVWAGAPLRLVTDAGPEFTSQEFRLL